MLDAEIAHLLELRLRVRRNPQGRALVDRCLLLLARAADARAEDLPAIEAEFRGIADTLALKFGAPKDAVLQ